MTQTQTTDATILVCDDDEVLLGLVCQTLHKKGYEVIETEGGQEAIAAYLKHTPDLILMDANMPGMDGFEATQKIQSLATVSQVPIIMITALEDDKSVKKAFDAGAVEYVTKPILWPVLLQRIHLQIEAQKKKKKIQKQNKQLSKEREFIEDIISFLRKSKSFDPEGLNYLIEPVEKTTGDILLSARRPDGAHHVLLGDVTGHGLPAAIIGPTVANIFYSMTAKGFSPGSILNEINKDLYTKLPANLFLAGSWIAIDATRKHLEVWGGAMLDVLIFRGGKLFKKIPSKNMALGTRRESSFNMIVNSVAIEKDDRIIAYSDGIAEQKNSAGEMFGNNRVIATIIKNIQENAPLEQLKKVLDEYRGEVGQEDDVTVVEIIC
ncbi:MAG: fused response regulator/phosphatase [Magnetococcales bacterium]|nr:fused response regulator/phosphatase [Magnetococcales bacterium]